MARVYSIDDLVPVVHPTAYVHPTAILIGDVIVGANCYIGPAASLRGDFGRIVVNEGSNIQDSCVLHCAPGVDTLVEAYGHIGHAAVLHSCRIGHNVLVGMNAVVMDGASIGEHSFVAACTFVKGNMSVPARSLVAGIPGRIVRTLTNAEIDWKSEGTRLYQELAQRCHATMQEVDSLSEPEPNRKRFPQLVAPKPRGDGG